MRARIAVLTTATVLLTGCGNITSIYRPLTLEGKSVSLDAKQRVVATSQSAGSYVLCAEPSPDALSAYGSSVSGTLSSSEAQAQVAQAFAEQAASIGLRTQSIQLMRDAMYRACEGYLSGGLGQEEFYFLQRRFQNLTLGLLAIEQLTGAVKADQANLSTASGAATGDNTEQESEALKNARAAQNVAQDAAEVAKVELEGVRKKFQAATNDLTSAQQALAKANPQTQALKDAVTSAEEALTTASSEFKQKQVESASKQRALATALQNTGDAEQNLTLARARVKAYASGTAQFGPASQTRLAVTDKVAKAVQEIVKNVLTESGSGEGCQAIIRDSLEHKDLYNSPPWSIVLANCTQAVAADKQKKAADAENRNLMLKRDAAK